jgi:hypothetical protein
VEQQYVEVKDRLAVSASFASEFDDSFFWAVTELNGLIIFVIVFKVRGFRLCKAITVVFTIYSFIYLLLAKEATHNNLQ